MTPSDPFANPPTQSTLSVHGPVAPLDLSIPHRLHVVGVGGPGMSAIAIALAEMGHAVSGSDLREHPVLERVRAAGATVHCFEEVPFAQAYVPGVPPAAHHWGGDLQVAEILDRVDHVVVSIGMCSGTFGFPFWNLAPSVWSNVLEVNLVAAVRVAHTFVPYMLVNGGGTICFVASVAGQTGSQTDPPYSAAKAGLINFAQCAAKDLASYNVRVNAVSPGMVKTPMNQQVWQGPDC